jgi:hypothetical protein
MWWHKFTGVSSEYPASVFRAEDWARQAELQIAKLLFDAEGGGSV